MDKVDAVVAACIVLASLLVVFAITWWFLSRPRGFAPSTRGIGFDAEPHGASDVAKLVEAFAKLAEALTKAGPAVVALVVAALLLALAAITAVAPSGTTAPTTVTSGARTS